MPTPNNPPYIVKFGSIDAVDGPDPGMASQPDSFIVNDYVECNFISVGSNGDIGECRLQGLPDAFSDTIVDSNTPVQVFSVDYSGDSPEETNIFDGIVYKSIENQSGTDYDLQYICYNRGDDFLRRAVMSGQIWQTITQEQDYYDNAVVSPITGVTLTDFEHTDKPIIFNPNGKGNCCAQSYLITPGAGVQYDIWLFDALDRNQINATGDPIVSIPWTVKRALHYIRNFYNTDWAIDPQSWDDINLSAVFGDYDSERDYVLFNVNLEGKSLVAALQEILEPYGAGFYIEPGLNGNNKHGIYFFFRQIVTDPDTEDILYTPPNSGIISMDTGGAGDQNCFQYEIVEDATPVINQGKFMGNQVVHTTLAQTDAASNTLLLAPAWAAADLSYTYYDDSSTVNTSLPLFTHLNNDISGTVKYGIGRMWIVNQGDNSEIDEIDLYTTFNTANDPRGLQPPKYFQKGIEETVLQQLPIIVEASCDNGSNWFVVESSHYQILNDRMGIVFTTPNLEDFALYSPNNTGPVSYWQALKAGHLKIRIICSFKADERVQVTATDTGSAKLICQREYENLGYDKFVNHTEAEASVYYTDNTPVVDDTDDTDKLTTIAWRSVEYTNKPIYSGLIVVLVKDTNQTSSLLNAFAPGNVVQEIYNRRDFSANPPSIFSIVLDPVSRHLQISLSMPSGQVPVSNSREKYHKNAMRQLGSANRVNYIPGDTKSQADFYNKSYGQEQ